MESIKTKCSLKGHENYEIGLVCLKVGCKKPRLLCMKCTLTHGEHAQSFLTIEDLRSANEYQIEGWPMDSSGRRIQELLQNLKCANLEEKIEEAFVEAEERILNSLKKVKEDMKKTLLEQPSESKVKIMESLSTSFHSAYSLDSLKAIVFDEFFNGSLDLDKISEKIDAQLQSEDQKKALSTLKDSMKDAKKVSYLSNEFFKKTSDKLIALLPDFKNSLRSDGLTWRWQISTIANSSRIQAIEEGVCFKGSGSGSHEFFYSTEGWDSGVHTFIMEFEPWTESPGYFYCGLVPDNEKASFSSFGSYPNRSLFASSSNQVNVTKGTDFIPTLREGGLVTVTLDIDNNQMTYEDDKETTKFELDTSFTIRGRKWAFIFSFNGSGAKETVRLLSSD